MRNRHAGEPFTDSDEEIAAALQDVSIPALMMSCVHMTDDDAVRRGIFEGPRPLGLFLNEVQGYMSEEDKATARAQALTIIKNYRDRGCPEPEPIDPALLKQMMDWIVAAEVPDEYVPMMLEEMELDGADARDARDHMRSDLCDRTNFPVLVIGAGESGLLAAIRLKQAGIPFTVIEKNPGVGGTWWENSYPGARVDVGNHFYCYSFEPSDHWTEFFARQPELQAYFTDVMNRHGVAENIRFSTQVLSARWDEADASWAVTVRKPNGDNETLYARAVISAVGQLNAPFIPDLPGAADFRGPTFHTARWDHDVDLRGKNVVMIGAGASGFQIAPAIAGDVGRLTIFQRTAQWMFPNPNYHEAVGPGVQWALRHLPFYGRWYRFLIFWPGCDSGLAAAKVDPAWPDQQRAVSEANDIARMMFTQWIESQLDGDEELAAKVIPDYPATGKRTLQDNGSWLATLRRDNVELVRCGIDHIEEGAVVDNDGHRHPADVLIYATGFRVNDFLSSLHVTGRDGIDLHEVWARKPAAYLGITIPGFPNFFCMYGPGTNLASGGSLIFHSECQMRYIMSAIDLMLTNGKTAMEPSQHALDDWYDRTQAEMKTMVWAHPGIKHSFYKNADGVVNSLSPWRLVDYWAWTRAADPAHYSLR